MKKLPVTKWSKEDKCYSRGQKMRCRRFKGHIKSADVTCFCSVNLPERISAQMYKTAWCNALCQSPAAPGTNFCLQPRALVAFGALWGPQHTDQWMTACRRDAGKHIFYQHLKALPPVGVFWHHLYSGLRRFRAFAFAVEGEKKKRKTSPACQRGVPPSLHPSRDIWALMGVMGLAQVRRGLV